MSKVRVLIENALDSYPVSAAVIATGWMPGQAAVFNSTGTSLAIGSVDNVVGVLVDDDNELSAPPTGSLATVAYGSGTKILIDHSAEVAAGSAARAYNSNVESISLAAPNLYIGTDGKWTTTASGSVKGVCFQIPNSGNNYSLGVITRF